MDTNDLQINMAELEKFISGLIFRSFAPNEKLVSDRLIDSINLVELVVFIESRFQIKISAHDMTAENFDHLEQITTLIQSKLSAKGAKI